MQVASFALSAVYSGVLFVRWVRDDVKNRMWQQLGWFSGLVCMGSVAGAVAWGIRRENNSLNYEYNLPGIETDRPHYALLASTYRFNAAFNIMYGLEFMCLMIPKLMMLGRLTNNAARSLQVHAQEQGEGRCEVGSGGAVARAYRVTAAAVVLCSVVGMVALDVSGAYGAQAAGVLDHAAAACDPQCNNANSSLALFHEALAIKSQANTAFSVQAVLEAIALLLISSAYIILVPFSVAMFRRAERVGAHALFSVAAREDAGDARSNRAAAIVDDTIQAAAQQRRRLVIACVVVLVTFPARAAFNLLNSYATFNDLLLPNPACGLCDPCQLDPFIIGVWLIYTPEFQPVVVALSSPLPLVVSLWIITGAHARAYAIALSILRARLGR